MTLTNCVAVITALAISARAVSGKTANSSLCTQEPASWCCQLGTTGDVCAQYGTKRMLARICSAYPNEGVDCDSCASHPSCAATAAPDAADGVDPAVLTYLRDANLSSAAPHLYFYWVNTFGDGSLCKNGFCRCGDIDAASRMPAELFEPQNIVALARYVTLTVKSYSSLGMGNQTLGLGRCNQKTNYTCGGSGVQGINWVTSALMQPICKAQCDCNYPACRDQPDDPEAGKFCSLCGPKYNSDIVINLWNLPNSDDDNQGGDYGPCGENLGKTIPEVVAADPDLSTLLRLVQAADVASKLASPGPWTLFAPSNKAFQALPPFTVARLLQPKNKAELVDLLLYHLVPDSYCTIKTHDNRGYCDRNLDDGLTLRTEEGKSVNVTSNYVGPPPYTRDVRVNGANVVTADVRADDSVVHVIDAVLLPPKA